MAKKGEGEILKVIAGSPDKPLKIGNTEIEAYVLSNGMRVLSNMGFQRAVGLSDKGGRIAEYIGKPRLKPFIQNEIIAAVNTPIKFYRPTSTGSATIANGIEATMLKKFCDLVLKARHESEKELTSLDKEVARQAEILLGGFAELGIIALVDEVTGYQKEKDEYQKILAKYIAAELQPWLKTFGEDYYFQIYRLKGWDWNRFAVDKKNHPWAVANITNRIVYEKLPDGVLGALEELNPKNDKGNRSHRHFQHLTPDEGKVHLLKHLGAVVNIMESFEDGKWEEALQKIDSRFTSKRVGQQTTLPLDFHSADKKLFESTLKKASKPATIEKGK